MGSWNTSISWEARVLYDAQKLVDLGDEYTPTIKMRLAGESNSGWHSPVYLDIQLPGHEDVLSNIFKIEQIPLNRLHDVSFPTFTPPSGDKTMMTLVASSVQNTSLSSSLIIGDWVDMAEGKHTDHLFIDWNMEFRREFGAQSLTPGSSYKFAFPLVLKGASRGGWSDPVIIQVFLPDGKKLAKMVNPTEIPVNEQNMEFTSRKFTAPGIDKKITLVVSTTQRSNLHSILTVGDAKPKLVEY
uniref:Ribosomal RNA large subunit methyltransferase E n=1 Tax=Anthurium amnicola TaxID=1678845 RepID=A0A1D1YL39_9ARAE